MSVSPAPRKTRRRILGLAAGLTALSTVFLMGGLVAASAQGADRGSLASQQAIAKHVMGIVGASAQANKGNGNGNGHGKPSPTATTSSPSSSGGCTTITGYGINYHCGPILTGTTDMYYIWYGDWSGASKRQGILRTLAVSIGGSSWYQIQTSYYDKTGTHLTNSVDFAGEAAAPVSYGSRLSDSDIARIVDDTIAAGRLPKDTNGVYFVLTAAGVAEKSGFLTRYCGWHAYGTPNNAVQYSFVGDPTGPKLGNCAELTSGTINGDPGGDAMASVIAHELVESASDPELNAWYDNTGYENADKCAWKFGTSQNYNVSFSGNKFLIQQNWVNDAAPDGSNGYCALSY